MTVKFCASLTSLAFAGGLILIAGGTSAAVVESTVIDIAPAGLSTFTMTCTSCFGVTGSAIAGLSSTKADTYEIGKANKATLAAALSDLLGLSGDSVITADEVEKSDVLRSASAGDDDIGKPKSKGTEKSSVKSKGNAKDDDKGEDEDGRNVTYDVDPGYFFAKFSTYTSFFYTDTSQTVTFAKTGTGKGDLSNYGTIKGEINSAVPLPAAGWLMLAGISGLAALRRRKKN